MLSVTCNSWNKPSSLEYLSVVSHQPPLHRITLWWTWVHQDSLSILSFEKDPSSWHRRLWSWETCSWSPAPFATALSHLPGNYTKTKGASSWKQHYTCDRNNMRFEMQKLNYVPSWFLVVCNLESLEWGDSAHEMLFGHHTSWKLQPAASRRKAKRSLAWKYEFGAKLRGFMWREPGNVRY